MSFMLDIELHQRSPLEQLAIDFFRSRNKTPSIDFCRRALGVPENEAIVARRLGVAISTVRGWREIGARARGLSCE